MPTKRPKSVAAKRDRVQPALARSTAVHVHVLPVEADLLPELRELILVARRNVARGANAALVHLYWQVGTRIRKDILAEKRAEYGQQILPALGQHLEMEFGRGFGEKNLRRMVQFAEVFPDPQIVAALLRQLGWTHFTTLLPIEDWLKREFYAEMFRLEGWSTRTLRQKIDAMLYERTVLSRKPEQAMAGVSLKVIDTTIHLVTLLQE